MRTLKSTSALFFLFINATVYASANLEVLQTEFSQSKPVSQINVPASEVLRVGDTWSCKLFRHDRAGFLHIPRALRFKAVANGFTNEGKTDVTFYRSTDGEMIGLAGEKNPLFSKSAIRVSEATKDLVVELMKRPLGKAVTGLNSEVDPTHEVMGYLLCASADRINQTDDAFNNSGCGYSAKRTLTIEERIIDCGNTKVDGKDKHTFTLVAENPKKLQVWRDDSTNQIWTDLIPEITRIGREKGLFGFEIANLVWYVDDIKKRGQGSPDDLNYCRSEDTLYSARVGIDVDQVAWDVAPMSSLEKSIEHGIRNIFPKLRTNTVRTRTYKQRNWSGSGWVFYYGSQNEWSKEYYPPKGAILCSGNVIESTR